MDLLQLTAGTVAVRNDRLVIVQEIRAAGLIRIRDLVSGLVDDAPAGELSALV